MHVIGSRCQPGQPSSPASQQRRTARIQAGSASSSQSIAPINLQPSSYNHRAGEYTCAVVALLSSLTRDTALLLNAMTVSSGTTSPSGGVLLFQKLLLGMFSSSSLPALIFFSWVTSSSEAFPTGAGGCNGVQGSVGGPHFGSVASGVNSTVVSGVLADRGWIVQSSLSGSSFSSSLLPFVEGGDDGTSTGPSQAVLDVGTEYQLLLTVPTASGDGGQPFKGFLFRLKSNDNANQDTTAFVSVDPQYETASHVAAVCLAKNLGGVTHLNNDDKTEVGALLNVGHPGSYLLEVTAVARNSIDTETGNWVSQYYFNSYQLHFEGSLAPVTAPPNAAPQDVSAPTSGGHSAGTPSDASSGTTATSSGFVVPAAIVLAVIAVSTLVLC